VGERWQILPADVREACEQQANTAKEKYYSELAEYKKTPEYALYQEYLAEFKAKHGGTRAGAYCFDACTIFSPRLMRTMSRRQEIKTGVGI